MQDEVTVRIDVKKDLAKKFTALKEYYGLIHDTEVIRVLIALQYHAMMKFRADS